jgi:hypothetical protein
MHRIDKSSSTLTSVGGYLVGRDANPLAMQENGIVANFATLGLSAAHLYVCTQKNNIDLSYEGTRTHTYKRARTHTHVSLYTL